MKQAFALYYVPDGYSTGGPKLMGRQAAGAGFMKAAAAAAGLDEVGCYAASAAHARQCARQLQEYGYSGRQEWVDFAHPQQLARYGCLYHPAPDIARHAWRRGRHDHRAYSLCGITHTTASHAIMSGITDMLVAPLKSWDAVICTSSVVRDSVRLLLEEQADYLRARLGAQRFELPQLPLIPLGVHCNALRYDAARRSQARQQMQIGEGEVAFLFLGRLSFHAKAHPQQMFEALEQAAAAGSVHLILCGWFANEAIEQAFHEAAQALCPSVRLTVLDGRDPAAQETAWAGADVFVSLSDNIQETFGLTPVEAMAAGLPCLVSDWNGYRETVRDGVDGFRIPTLMPAAGWGEDLAARYDSGADSYDMYCGHASQAVAVDGERLAHACLRLVREPELRRQMGSQARQRAEQVFDWSVIFAQYRALWDDLDERRRADPELAVPLPSVVPDRPDPFRLFASYPSATLGPHTRLEPLPQASMEQVSRLRQLGINRFAHAGLPSVEEFERMLNALQAQAVSAADVLALFDPSMHARIARGLVWLCKMNLVRVGK